MKLRRREFIELVGASVASVSVPLFGSASSSVEKTETLEKNGWQVKVTPTGEIVSVREGQLELINRKLGDNYPRVLVVRKSLYVCNQPRVVRREGSKLVFQYSFSDRYSFSVDYEIELVPLSAGGVVLKQKVGLDFPTRVSESVKLSLPRNIQLPFENRKVFIPLKNGVGRRKPILGLENDDEYVFRLAGTYELTRPQNLAIPMVAEYSDQTDLRLTLCADPFFTSYFTLPYQEKIGQFHCIYLEQVGLAGREERTLYTGVQRGGEETAMNVFYETSLADVKAGPDWLHDVAMIDYDYLSENGQGWFADIDKLKEVIRPEDRNKVFLVLHGWYDYMGRYSFDYRTRALDKKWIAFPNARDPGVQALGEGPETREAYSWHKSSVERMRPVEMSLEDVHRRIRYGKDAGFRVGLFYSGCLYNGTGGDLYDPNKVLIWGGWLGPDTKGRSHQQNPLHPEVREFYKSYMQALLAEYGKEVDGFAWDETNDILPGALGTEAYPGYADRAMMTLMKEVATLVADFSPRLALFSSDNIGVWTMTDNAPYCLVAHGTYQDSRCRPEAWPYGLFPNFRNVLWSCNWAPWALISSSRYAVETFDAPVPISNGPFGEDLGVSEMNAQQVKAVLDLFEKRKHRKMEIGWIEENDHSPTYQGKEIPYKWSL